MTEETKDETVVIDNHQKSFSMHPNINNEVESIASINPKKKTEMGYTGAGSTVKIQGFRHSMANP